MYKKTKLVISTQGERMGKVNDQQYPRQRCDARQQCDPQHLSLCPQQPHNPHWSCQQNWSGGSPSSRKPCIFHRQPSASPAQLDTGGERHPCRKCLMSLEAQVLPHVNWGSLDCLIARNESALPNPATGNCPHRVRGIHQRPCKLSIRLVFDLI